jgi:hypothetical protein
LWKPAQQDDSVNGSNPSPRDCDVNRTFNKFFFRITDKQMRTVQSVGIDHGIVDNTQSTAIWEIDLKAGKTGY